MDINDTPAQTQTQLSVDGSHLYYKCFCPVGKAGPHCRQAVALWVQVCSIHLTAASPPVSAGYHCLFLEVVVYFSSLCLFCIPGTENVLLSSVVCCRLAQASNGQWWCAGLASGQGWTNRLVFLI